MAKKKKNELPSGNIRVRVYDYTDSDGKKHYQSFTAPTKTEANAMAAEWKTNKAELKNFTSVAKAVEGYIELKRGVLSANTVNGYTTDLRRIKKYPIANVDLKKITTIDLQQFVSSLATDGFSPKTVKNTYTLIAAALSVYIPKFDSSVTMPEAKRFQRSIPEQSDVQRLLDSCEELASKQLETKIAIALACKYTLRLSEVCALTFDDVDFKNKTISVNKAFVKVDRLYWELKQPKTYYSYRTLKVSDDVLSLIRSLNRKSGYIVDMNPEQLEKKYQSLKKKAGIKCRFHDLRHYAASSMHAAGIPQRYVETEGGWRPGSKVLVEVYQHVITEEMEKVQNMINDFSDLSL